MLYYTELLNKPSLCGDMIKDFIICEFGTNMTIVKNCRQPENSRGITELFKPGHDCEWNTL